MYKKEQNNQMLCYKQKQTEAEALELTYSHLGRLLQSAEMLAYKLNLFDKGVQFKYQTYDSFNIADKKDIDTIKYDVINFLDFYEKAIIIHNKKFDYVQPKSIHKVINNLSNWKNKASKDDKRFFISILDLIQKNSYDYSAFPDENLLYEKAKKDNVKFKKSPGFWKSFSIPILKFLENIIKKTQENVRNNPSYKPDIHFGSKATNNEDLVKTLESRKIEIKINEKINEINMALLNITQKTSKIKSQSLLNLIEELNNLYSKYEKNYGDVQIDKNNLSTLKTLISQIKLEDNKVYKMLRDISIDIDPDSMN